MESSLSVILDRVVSNAPSKNTFSLRRVLDDARANVPKELNGIVLMNSVSLIFPPIFIHCVPDFFNHGFYYIR